MNTEVEVHGSELRMLLVHESVELKPGVLQALDDADRPRIECLSRARRESRSLAAWSDCAFGESGSSAALHALAARFNATAVRLGCELRLHVDDAADRPALWFGFPAESPEWPAEVVAADVCVEPVVANEPPRRRAATVFVSYADADSAWAVPFIEALKGLARTHDGVQVAFWYDKSDLGSGLWRKQIREAVKGSALGLMLLTPAFLSSNFVRDRELPHFDYDGFDSDNTPCAVIECEPVDPLVLQQRGIDASQIISCRDDRGKCRYAALDDADKAAFASRVFTKLCDQLAPLDLPDADPAQAHARQLEAALARLAHDSVEHLQRNEAMVASWSDMDAEAGVTEPARVDLLDALTDWALDTGAPQFCALLGQYGTGKTTSLRRLARELHARHARGEAVPLPIYVDLRVGSPPSGGVPTLVDLLEDHIRGRETLRNAGVTAAELLGLVRKAGAVMLFDGLDEKAVRMSRGETRRFVNELWKTFGDTPDDALRCTGKLVISCRSHYFRDLREQTRMFLAAETSMARRAVRSGDATSREFPLFVLLPFGREQVLSYLVATLGDTEAAERAMALIEKTHDLGQLATRPVLLPHLVRQLAHLERCAARGEIVNAAAVYDAVVKEWLGRDEEKHQIDADDKRRLMEELAAKLHDEERQDLPVQLLDEWLVQRFRDSDALRQYSTASAERFQGDLRTATFIVRAEFTAGSDLFCFAHTSLAEYFLACHLVRALRLRQPQAWDIALPSQETQDFVAQLVVRLQPYEQREVRRAWNALLETGGRGAALAFRCWLSARRQGAPEPDPARVQLDGCDVRDIEIIASVERPLRLRNASFRGAWLLRAQLRHVDLQGADFSGAHLCDAEFDECVLDEARFDGADRGGMQVRFGSTLGEATQRAIGREGSRFAQPAVEDLPDVAPCDVRIVADDYYSTDVSYCAMSPDGQFVASARRDGCIRLIESATGRCLHVIPGWNRRGNVAFSPDSCCLLVPHRRGGLAIWDLTRGSLATNVGSRGSEILCCAFSPDGTQVMAGTATAEVSMWNLATGLRRTLLARRPPRARGLSGVTLSPDGSLVAIAFSRHVSVRATDAVDTRMLELRSADARFGVAFSADGSLLATAGSDGTVRYWRIADARLLRSVPLGPASRMVLSPDATRAAVWSEDDCLQIWDLVERSLGFVYYGANIVRVAQFVGEARLLLGIRYGYVELYDCVNGFCVRNLDLSPTFEYATHLSLCGDSLLTKSGTSTLRRWRVDGGFPPSAVELPPTTILAFSADYSAILGYHDAQALLLLDGRSGAPIRRFADTLEGSVMPAFSPDAQTIVLVNRRVPHIDCADASSALQLTLIGRASGRRLRKVSPGPYGSDVPVIVSDDTRVLIACDSQVFDWDVATSALRLLPLDVSVLVTSLAASPQGSQLLIGSRHGVLYLCNIDDGRCVQQFHGHRGPVTDCAFSGDGTRIVSAARDGTRRMWVAHSGEGQVLKDESREELMCLSVDGDRFATAVFETVRIWNFADGRCIRRLQLLPDGEFALFEPGRLAPLLASPQAWRHCHTRVTGADGRVRLLPAEALTGKWPCGEPGDTAP